MPASIPKVCPIAAVASSLSRLYLPPVEVMVRWPKRTGQIRAAGKWYSAFYAAACLFWLVVGLLACLFVSSQVSAIESLPSLNLPFASAITDPDRIWYCHGLSLAVLLVLQGTRKVWGGVPHARLRTIPSFVAFTMQMVCVILFANAAYVFGVSLLALSYPGLFGNDLPIARIHWSVWFAAAFGLMAFRGYSPVNRRLREYTHLVTHYGSMPYRPAPLLYALLFELWGRSAVGDTDGETSTGSGDESRNFYGLTRDEDDELRLEFLKACRAFYEREGVSDLRNPRSSERRFYTRTQRDALDLAYGKMVSQILSLEQQIRDRLARRIQASATEFTEEICDESVAVE